MTKTILDVLLEQGKITPDKAQGLKRGDFDNEKLEKIILQRQMASVEDVAKSWAVVLNLPFIHLRGKAIPADILQIIPQELVKTYQIVSYDRENDRLKLAIGQPSRLRQDVDAVLTKISQNKKIAIDLAITTADDIAWALQGYKYQPTVHFPSLSMEIPAVSSPAVSLVNLTLPLEVLRKFPIEVAERYKMVVFEAPSPQKIKVALVDPADASAQEILNFIRRRNGLEIEVYQAPADEMTRVLERYKKAEAGEQQSTINKQQSTNNNQQTTNNKQQATNNKQQITDNRQQTTIGAPSTPSTPSTPIAESTPTPPISMEGLIEKENDLLDFLKENITQPEQLKKEIITGNIPRLLAALICLAVNMKASDIHLEGEENDLQLRFRLDGILKDINTMPLTLQPPLVARIKILSELKIDEQRIPQDGRFQVKVGDREIDLRVSTLPTINGEKIALRLLDKSSKLLGLSEIGFVGKNLKLIEEALKQPHGIILVTGPTGSGKTTTLYSMISRLDKDALNIVTLEDPVEYNIEGVNQCQIKPKIFSFADGLRSILRQDPNIIMVGEIRDKETAELVTHAALTGHLVLTTLHTNDAAGAIPRLLNMGVEPFLIASAIDIIVAQRLVRRLCPACRQEIKPPAEILEEIKKELGQLPAAAKFYRPGKCDQCLDGYSGRVGIFEVLPVDEKMEEVVVGRARANQINNIAKSSGMVTMKQDGFLKVLQGITAIEEVLRATMAE
ncbi:MAG: general secretion pathway protein E [Candidatus Berkelbacteria bacterium Licking1014_2]|uniref:General secretion pathway protein E n=1 Tax=Candidatus Berkelbacteria bacterium Licking1014_2 TaxID=2017146 RepID=A0A554LU28_9BACT|nr:MAG: general secretion pathway protein E [Candidatus Berkelbacteria bacterium Licking1014_2]